MRRLLQADRGHYECEVLEGIGQETEESARRWRQCHKNPDHTGFMSPEQFLEDYMPRLPTVKRRKSLSAMINLTVRLKVYHTSKDRAELSSYSTCAGIRLGSGFIDNIAKPVNNKSCPCPTCKGEVMRTFWEFHVVTAHHVVFNTEEAKKTQIDMFYDDEYSQYNGQMKTVWGLEVQSTIPNKDYCRVLCVTHDKELGEKLESVWLNSQDKGGKALDIADLSLLTPYDRDRDPAVIVSHPHGQPKKITVGEMRYRDKEGLLVKYDTCTCAGCSGAPVFVLDLHSFSCLWLLTTSVHSGTYTGHWTGPKNQVNYGYHR